METDIFPIDSIEEHHWSNKKGQKKRCGYIKELGIKNDMLEVKQTRRLTYFPKCIIWTAASFLVKKKGMSLLHGYQWRSQRGQWGQLPP